jgi:hypothetical protein
MAGAPHQAIHAYDRTNKLQRLLIAACGTGSTIKSILSIRRR